jgi:DNA polymerase-1
MKTPLYVIDGYALIFRAYFAFIRNPLLTPDGFNVSAIHGFTRALLSILKDYGPERLVVSLDSRTPTFRDEMYPEYKMTRDKTPEDLKAQFPVIEKLLHKFCIPTIRHNGVEADDIIATLARRCSAEGRRCYIVSGDKDLYQLVDEQVRILKPSRSGGFDELDGDGVFRDKGVRPDQIIDYLALLGDSADNVPGVRGIGQKTAEKLLAEYRTLDGIYENIDNISSANWRKKLEEGRELAELSRRLVILKEDVELEAGPDDLHLNSLNGPAAAEVLQEYQIRTLAAEIKRVCGADPGGGEPWYGMEAPRGPEMDPGGGQLDEKTDGGGAAQDSGALSAEEQDAATKLDGEIDEETGRLAGIQAEYELVRDEKQLRSWVERCRKAGTYAFDTETDSLDALKANLAGFSLSDGAGAGCYVPLASPELRPGDMPNGSHLTEGAALPIVKELLEDSECRLVGQNIKYDYKIMARRDIVMANPWFDTMIAGWLLDTSRNAYGMDALAEQYLGYRTQKLAPLYEEVTGEKLTRAKSSTLDFSRIPLDKALFYAAEDADITFRLYRLFELLLRRRDVREDSQTRLFFELEMPLIPIFARMELEGIELDIPALNEFSDELGTRLGEIEEEIHELVGHEFNIASTKQLQTVLFEERKLTPGKKTKTGYSTDTSVLEELAKEDRVPELVLKHRTLSKLKSTYVESLPEMVNSRTGRIHTSFQQNGTATGRISSHDPNLQNIPIRDDEGRRIREAFVPRKGHRFVSADYSQIELVILAHLSGDPGLSRAFSEGEDVHRLTGSLIFQIEPEEVSSLQRRIAKSINFGVMYGMSAFRLAREIGISRSEAQNFIDAYFKTYSGIRKFIDATVAEAEKNGYVSTMMGRRRPLPAINSSNKNEKMGAQRVAVNTPIQGSAADIVKRAMLNVAAELDRRNMASRMLLQVHDELIFECPEDEVESVSELLREIMPGAVELSVPLRVNVEAGDSWGEMH